MKNAFYAAAGAIMAASAASAGGIERAHSPYAILWEKGNYAELSFGSVKPKTSGTVGAGTVSSGDMTDRYNQLGFSVKYALNDRLDLAVVLDQSLGADVAYPDGGLYPLRGSRATIDSNSLSLLARYKFDDNWSIHGGIRATRTEGSADLRIPLGAGLPYTLRTSTETDFGYILGAAYERPDIALRVALTYQSAIKHDFNSTETFAGVANGAPINSGFRTEIPQSLTLDFQTGIAADTLLFGSVRWREWSKFNITPTVYNGIGGALVDYSDDVVTYTLGVGRRFNENWSGSIAVAHEKSNNLRTGNLGPHDGMTTLTIGAAYTKDNMKISAGASYVWIGDAQTKLPIGGYFRDNKALGIGVKVGFTF